MNFINYISVATKQAPDKNIYGEVSNSYFLENITFINTMIITEIEGLRIYFSEKENRLDIDFLLLYKNFKLAEITIELYNPSQFDFIGNQERITSLQNSIKQLNGVFDTIFKFELSNKNIIIQAKNDEIDFQLKTHFNKIDMDVDFLNTISFIDAIENQEKNNELFYSICNTVTNEQLTSISQADYYSEEIAYQELVLIRDTKTIPKEILAATSEVLSLTCYSKPVTVEEHQEKIFIYTIILLGDYEHFDNIERVLTGFFLSVIKLNYLTQTRSFFINLLATKRLTLNNIHVISYLVLGCDLLLKDEKFCSETLCFLQETNFLQEINFDHQKALTIERIKETTLILLKNTSFIKDIRLKEAINNLFISTICICEERLKQ